MHKKSKRSLLNEEEHFEISLTPLIDTILVLLIVFIIISPQLESILKIEIPSSKGAVVEEEQKTNSYFCVAMNQFGVLYYGNGKKASQEEILFKAGAFLRDPQKKAKNAILFVDKDALSGNVVYLIGALYDLGFNQVYVKTKNIDFL
jgi:biopolymer transport protein TolR